MVRYDKQSADAGRKYIDDQRGPRRRGGSGAKAAGGLGGVGAIIFILFQLFTGGDPSSFNFDQTAFDGDQAQVEVENGQSLDPASDPDAETVEYLQFLMFDIQETWKQVFAEAGIPYVETQLTPFTDSVNTNGCGQASSAVGPFYCPAPRDQKVYIDLDFFDQLRGQFGAPGDFAQAYVVAHEIGHHVQSITRTSEQIAQAKRDDPSNANSYAILQELQADCYAGIWAHSANRRTTIGGEPIIEVGDIEEGLRAAESVGDDSIQAQSGLRVNPESWTHGSSDQRQKWFMVGFETGSAGECEVDEIGKQEPF